MTWFGWALIGVWVLNLLHDMLTDDDGAAIGAVLVMLMIGGVLIVGTGDGLL